MEKLRGQTENEMTSRLAWAGGGSFGRQGGAQEEGAIVPPQAGRGAMGAALPELSSGREGPVLWKLDSFTTPTSFHTEGHVGLSPEPASRLQRGEKCRRKVLHQLPPYKPKAFPPTSLQGAVSHS